MDVALTVDVEARDHACRPGNFGAMVDVMVAASAPATLFVQGGWAEARATAAELEALRAPGMAVGLHGHTHRRFGGLSEIEIHDELERAERALHDGGAPAERPLFRLPYLDGNTDGFVLQTVAARGWWHVDCHAVAYDWKDELRDDSPQVARNVIEGIERRRAQGETNAITLFHSWPDPAPDAVRRVVDHVRQRGDRFVPLTDVPRREWNNGIRL